MDSGFPATRPGQGACVRDYSPDVEYQLVDSDDLKREIYAMRYDAFRRDHAIPEREDGLFIDFYDSLPNCYPFLIRYRDETVASIRLHVVSPEFRKSPSMDVFPDILGPMIEEGHTVIDPGRFVTTHMAMLRVPELAYIALRVPSMASLAFEAKYCFIAVREDYIRFYKRALNAVQLCEPRPYPELRYRVCAMRVDVPDVREELADRYGHFRTPLDEWRRVFNRTPSLPTDMPDNVPTRGTLVS